MIKQRFPPGWDENRVREVLAHYESQTEDEQFAEIEAAREAEGMTLTAIPAELVPAVCALLAHKQMPERADGRFHWAFKGARCAGRRSRESRVDADDIRGCRAGCESGGRGCCIGAAYGLRRSRRRLLTGTRSLTKGQILKLAELTLRHRAGSLSWAGRAGICLARAELIRLGREALSEPVAQEARAKPRPPRKIAASECACYIRGE